MKKVLLLIFCTLIPSLYWGITSLHAEQQPARERIAQAERYVTEGEIDFAFMEFRALLEEHPEDPSAREATFAIGEYYFKQHSVREAKGAFEKFSEESTEEIPKLIATAYLLQCARLSEDTSSVQALESHLKEILSSKKIFLAFEENHTQKWNSPLGNHFEVREFVDRMEILLNDVPFCSVSLP